MRIANHLMFRGNCAEAFTFYARVLGGQTVTMIPYRDSPMADQVPPDWRDRIMHATLALPADELMGADVLPEQYHQPQGFSLHLAIEDPARARAIFDGLAEGGTVTMPMQETFWSAAFGALTDRFGITWAISCESAATG